MRVNEENKAEDDRMEKVKRQSELVATGAQRTNGVDEVKGGSQREIDTKHTGEKTKKNKQSEENG